MADISRDLDRYLRRRGESKGGYTGPSWFDRMFSSAEGSEELSPKQKTKLERVEKDIVRGEREIEAMHEVEHDLEEQQEQRVGFYHQMMRFFRQEKEPAIEPELETYDAMHDETGADLRAVAQISLRWMQRLPLRVKQEFKESEDYTEFSEILQRHGIAKKK